VAGLGEHALGETPGIKTVLLRGLAGAPVRQSGVAVAAQRTLRGGVVRARRARVWGGAGTEDEVQRGAGGIFRAADHPWCARPGWKARRGSRRDSADVALGEEEAARWVGAVNEGAGESAVWRWQVGPRKIGRRRARGLWREAQTCGPGVAAGRGRRSGRCASGVRVERAVRLAGPSTGDSGEVGQHVGPGPGREGEEADAGWAGVWAGLGWFQGFLPFLFPFLFLISNQTKPI
jgi:hypothetical protein